MKVFKNLNVNFRFKFILKYLTILSILILLIFTFPINIYANSKFAKNNYSRAVMEDNGDIYIQENMYKRIYPASMTKIAIAIVSIENLNLKDKIKIEKLNYKLPSDYITTPLYVGETLTVEDLLHATMLKSSNDAPIYLANKLYGNMKNFSKEINIYLKDLGLLDTNFTNPFGLEDSNHYTTSYDLLLLTKHAMKNDTFRKIINTKKYIIPANAFSSARTFQTTSLFSNKDSSLYDSRFYGIKTGFTDQSGFCFITATKIREKEYYFIYTGGDSLSSRFTEITKTYNQMKALIENKLIVDNYVKNTNLEKKSLLYNVNNIYSQFFFTTFDKISLIVFIFLFFIIFFRLKGSKVKNKKNKKK